MLMPATATVATPPSTARTWRATRWPLPSLVRVTGAGHADASGGAARGAGEAHRDRRAVPAARPRTRAGQPGRDGRVDRRGTGDGAGAQRVTSGGAVVGPEDRLEAVHALRAGAVAKPSLFRFGIAGGALEGLVDGERAVLDRRIVVRPLQVSSQTAHRPARSGSHCRSMTLGEAAREGRDPGEGAAGRQRVGVDPAVALEPDEEEPVAVAGVRRRRRRPRRCCRRGSRSRSGSESGHPGDPLEAGVGRDRRQVGGEVPLVGRGQRGARRDGSKRRIAGRLTLLAALLRSVAT